MTTKKTKKKIKNVKRAQTTKKIQKCTVCKKRGHNARTCKDAAQELAQMQLDYVKATPDQKAALRAVAIHRFANYDPSKLPPDLQAFLVEMHRDAMTVRP